MTPDELCTEGAVRHCLKVAAAFFPRVRDCDRDDLVSAALYGLAEASVKFDPAAGVPFLRYAGHLAKRHVMTAVRNLRPLGYRHPRKDPRATPPATARGDALRPLAADEPPVGWEAESEDLVRAVAARLSPARAEALLARFLHAGENAHERLGLTKQALSDRLKFARVDARKNHPDLDPRS